MLIESTIIGYVMEFEEGNYSSLHIGLSYSEIQK